MKAGLTDLTCPCHAAHCQPQWITPHRRIGASALNPELACLQENVSNLCPSGVFLTSTCSYRLEDSVNTILKQTPTPDSEGHQSEAAREWRSQISFLRQRQQKFPSMTLYCPLKTEPRCQHLSRPGFLNPVRVDDSSLWRPGLCGMWSGLPVLYLLDTISTSLGCDNQRSPDIAQCLLGDKIAPW